MKTSYTKQEKQELIKRYYGGESASDICLQTGIPRSTFYTWIKPYKVTRTASGVELCPVDFARQKKRIEKLENIIEVLQTVDCTVSSPLQVKLKELTKLYGDYSVHVLCDSLNVPRGTFYNHVLRNKKGDNYYKSRRTMLCEEIRKIYDESNQIYGARKIRAVLRARGIYTTDKMVIELMQSMNIESIRSDTKRHYNRFIKEGKKDVLKMNFSALAPNQVWVSDITYFRVCNTTRYICVMVDLYSRKVVAYKISQKQSTQLVTATFKLAYQNRNPKEKLIFHSDRGSQYTSFAFRRLLKMLNITQSFSPTGSPYHNAVMESFFASLKRDELYRINYRSIREFNQSVKNYMENYNDKRPHASLRYKAPNAFEQRFYEQK